MRALLRPFGHLFRWPVRISVFLVHLLHHLAAFFARIWMLVHVAGAVAQAGLQAGRLWEARVLTDAWEQGTRYFSVAGGLGWQRILAFALIPALSGLRAVRRLAAPGRPTELILTCFPVAYPRRQSVLGLPAQF